VSATSIISLPRTAAPRAGLRLSFSTTGTTQIDHHRIDRASDALGVATIPDVAANKRHPIPVAGAAACKGRVQCDRMSSYRSHVTPSLDRGVASMIQCQLPDHTPSRSSRTLEHIMPREESLVRRCFITVERYNLASMTIWCSRRFRLVRAGRKARGGRISVKKIPCPSGLYVDHEHYLERSGCRARQSPRSFGIGFAASCSMHIKRPAPTAASLALVLPARFWQKGPSQFSSRQAGHNRMEAVGRRDHVLFVTHIKGTMPMRLHMRCPSFTDIF